ncbi:unnamed protein product, partial [Brassica rapa]
TVWVIIGILKWSSSYLEKSKEGQCKIHLYVTHNTTYEKYIYV